MLEGFCQKRIPSLNIGYYERFLGALGVDRDKVQHLREIVYRENNLSFNGNRTVRIRAIEIEDLIFDSTLNVWIPSGTKERRGADLFTSENPSRFGLSEDQ